MEQVGKYQLVRKLALGGMAEVFLAKAAGPHGFEKTLVVKRILPQLAQDPNCIQMFLSEARYAAQLNHPNIAQVFDFGEVDGTYYIAMEYIDGPNLRTVIKRTTSAGSPLSIGIASRIICLVSEGLAYAHDFANPETGAPLGLIHRDVTPENILVARNGTVKVVDFGVVKAAGQANLTVAGTLKGKMAYMAPEQILGLPLDRRTDIFALGIVFYELLTGKRPFEAVNEVAALQAILYQEMIPASSRRADIPAPVQAIVDRALTKNRNERYGSCREIQAELERVIATLSPVGSGELSQLALEVLAASGQPSRMLSPPPPGSKSKVRVVVTPPRPAPGPARLGSSPGDQVILAEDLVIEEGSVVDSGGSSDRASSQRSGKVRTELATATARPAPAEGKPAGGPAAATRRSARGAAVVAASLVLLGGGAAFLATRNAGGGTDSQTPEGQLARVTIESVPPAQLRVNGRRIGGTPAQLRDLSPGNAKVEVYDPALGFFKEAVFSLQPGDNGVKRVVVEQGTVEFDLPPDTTVLVDGKKLGQTPIPPLMAYEGKHSVELLNPRFEGASKTEAISIEVRANSRTTVKTERTVAKEPKP